MYKLLTRINTLKRCKGRLLYLIIVANLIVIWPALGLGQVLRQLITVEFKNATIKDAFKELNNLAGVKFMYSSKDLDENKKVSGKFVDKSTASVIDFLLSGQNVTYSVRDNTIIIRKVTQSKQQLVQQRSLTGQVVDEQGKPLGNVTVKTNTNLRQTVTDDNGNFSIAVAADDHQLIFTLLGYSPSKVDLTGQTNYTVRLTNAEQGLDEVVVVGYGTQKKVNLTGAVSSVSGEDIAARPAGQTSAALQGLAPGVTVTQRSGQPGADGGNIRIRGIGTTGNANPMVLIDGVEGSMNNIDPNLIESVSILKDAASASIYGSRAANGVILITTKRGVGDKVSISYNNYFGWQSPTNMPDIVNALDHMSLTNEAYTNVGSSPLYSEELMDAYRAQGNGSSDLYPNTDWQKESLTGSGFQQSHFLTINGGTDKVKMLASFGYFDQNGLTANSNFKRYTIRNNMDITFSERLSARVDLQYVNPILTSPSAGIANIFQWMNSIPANQSFRNSDGTWGLGWNGSNPVSAAQDGGMSINKSPFGSINAFLTYKPVDWLTAELNYAPKYSTDVNKNFRQVVQSYYADGSPAYAVPQRSALTQRNAQQLYNNMRATLTVDKSISDHTLRWLIGASREDFTEEWIQGFRDTYVLPEFPVLDAGQAVNQQATGSASEWALQSFFSRLNYDYKEKYLLEVNARYDGSSRFLKGNRYGFFPSASAGWRFSEEPFMENTKHWLVEGKVRVSWGRLGNQNIGTYPAVAALDLGSYTLGGGIIGTAALNNLSNPNITWESTEEKNIGLDLTLFSRLNLTADYYYRKTNDILLLLDIPMIIGLAAPYQNVGVVENRGWEFAATYNSDFQREFRYSITANLSDVKNKVLDMRGVNNTGLTVNREGYPIGSIFGYEVEGYFQSEEEIADHPTQFGTLAPGDIKYANQNDDGIINETDKVVIGSTVPRYTYSLNGSASYKGFDASILLQGVGKADGYLYGAGIQPFTTTGAIGGTIREDNKDRWTPENRDATYPRLAFGQNNNAQASQFWMRDAAYLRLKNAQIGYTFPQAWLSRTRIQRLRIFANGTNLFSVDDFWDGYDVEAPVGTGNFYPQVKVYTFGLDITF
ncbi:SusC/RagA family TonB-linked outer membrane protein [Sphingobacterium haloxyli]|uniref:SusC/RagA family protein n=1 Tax=Sphingobacterium haloxyli TaxID=2100533 RepID=A0A2S9J3R9_9SPHI|nr:SusC/RagA family TonB-linked outer membrane protein [Sphingobacterium haloxyli]PRD47446.1 SusC/RagA family protein [Sphingobacterium haloxyli]